MFVSPKLVLIADDDPLLVALVAHHLQAAGFSVQSAGDGQAALDAIRARRPAVVILDSLMPVMGGVEVLRRMRSEGRLATTKVIMLTTLKDERHVVTAFELGAADFVAKPFSPDELILRIKRFALAASL